jgi:hypothetical protein
MGTIVELRGTGAVAAVTTGCGVRSPRQWLRLLFWITSDEPDDSDRRLPIPGDDDFDVVFVDFVEE